MAGNPKPDTNTNFIFCYSMAPSSFAPLLLLLLAVFDDAYASPSPSPSPLPSSFPTSDPAPYGLHYGPSSYFSPPSPPPPLLPDGRSLPPLAPPEGWKFDLNYGEKVGLAFLGLALAAQVVLGGYLAFKRWQLGKLEHGRGGGRKASAASSPHASCVWD